MRHHRPPGRGAEEDRQVLVAQPAGQRRGGDPVSAAQPDEAGGLEGSAGGDGAKDPVGGVYKYATGVVMAVPGLVVLFTNLPTPPDDRVLFRAVTATCTALAILILLVNRQKHYQKDSRVLLRWVGGAFAIF